MFDFTIKQYTLLLETLIQNGYCFQTLHNFVIAPKAKAVVLRHDIDLLPKNALQIATIESSMGIAGTYYFRAVPESWDEQIIRKIAAMGHEVGYHYESLTTCNGNIPKAFDDFKINLENLRNIVPVSTICMHGSPRSPYDSRDLWKHFDYKSLQIIAEPYFDLPYSTLLYLTDTGRRWDGYKVSVRDKIPMFQEEWESKGWLFHSTNQIINAIKEGNISQKIVFTIHPQRWHRKPLPWIKEYIFQNIKNRIKQIIIKTK